MKKQRRGEGGAAPPPADAPAAAAHADPRFAAVHSNPRFARFPKAKSKVEIDQRFSGVFSDPKFKRQTVVDKRGRATGAKERTDDLRRFYRLPDEDAAAAEEAAPHEDDDGEDASASDLSDEHGIAPAFGREGARRGIRGSVSVSSSSSDEDDESEEGSGEEGVLAQFVSGEEDVPLIDATYRLAVVDLEWDRMRAVDVFAVLRSFLPTGGRIVRVTVYPSDFGLARMKEEEEHGPRGAFASAGDGDDSEDEETTALDAEKLRVYERERLRFYYAIVECDSAATAAGLYKQCDGLEFERSSTRLDLRYVPDEQSFEGREPRDVALAVPAEYTPVDYTTKALQQTRVTLTWDADDPERKKQLRRKLTSEQLRDEDFAAYLGSGSEDEQDEDEKQAAARLRDALLGDAAVSAGAGGKRSVNANSDEDAAPGTHVASRAPRDEGMIVTFGMGLEERISAKRAAANQSPETVWQAHLRERKEKKRAAKNTIAAPGGELHGGEAAGAQGEDLGFNDPFFASADDGGAASRRKKKRSQGSDAVPVADAATARDEARRRAELELLLLDDARLKAGAAPLHVRAGARDDAAIIDGDVMQLSRKEARAAAKAAKKAARLARTRGGADGNGAELNSADIRFSALFTRPEFALDPTDSRFKAVRSVEAIRRESAARRGGGAALAGVDAVGTAHHESEGDLNLTSVVAKLKRKAGAIMR